MSIMAIGISQNPKTIKMPNSVTSNEMAHYEPSYLDLHCLQRYLFWSAGMKGWLFFRAQLFKASLA